jgi:hypothetical protein
MLWNLLICACFFTAVGGAWSATNTANLTLGGHIVIVAVGVVIGTACAIGMWRVGEAAGARASRLQVGSQQAWLIRAIYASSIFWIVIAAALVNWAGKEIVRCL